MPGNVYIYEYSHLKILEKLTNPYYLKTELEHHYKSPDIITERVLDEEEEQFNKKISEYFNHRGIKWNRRKPNSQGELAKVLDSKSDLNKIAIKASNYFQQGLEMYKTSLMMDINSSPLVEYYSFLQCIKGCAIIQLKLNESLLFSRHGISSDFESNIYPRAIIKAYGVFHVILLISDANSEMDNYFTGKIDLTLNSLIKKNPVTPASSFIVSYLLSTLVRYHPDKWQAICRGLEDDIFLEIREFRRNQLPASLEQIFPDYLK